MIGLFIKDLLNLKTQLRFIVLIFAFYTVLSFTTDSSTMLTGVIAMMAVMMPITALGYDEKAKWDKYALSMPLSRNDLVLSKYLLGITFSLVGFVLNFSLSLLIGFSSYRESLILSIVLFAVGVIFLSITMPPMFKYGIEKGRVIMMGLIFSPAALLLILNELDVKMPDAALLEKYWYLLPVIGVLVLLVSIGISVRIYRQKEF